MDGLPEHRTSRRGAEGTKHYAAIICLARRRCDVILAMLRNNEPYRTTHPNTGQEIAAYPPTPGGAAMLQDGSGSKGTSTGEPRQQTAGPRFLRKPYRRRTGSMISSRDPSYTPRGVTSQSC